MKCNPSPNTLFSTAPTYRTTPLCPAWTITTDSDSITIITTKVIIAARIFNLLSPIIDREPTYSSGSPSGVLLSYDLPDLLKGFLISISFSGCIINTKGNLNLVLSNQLVNYWL